LLPPVTKCVFFAGKCSKMRLRLGLRPGSCWGSLQRSPSAANLFTVDSRHVVPAVQHVRGVIARTRYINVLTYLLTYLHQ